MVAWIDFLRVPDATNTWVIIRSEKKEQNGVQKLPLARHIQRLRHMVSSGEMLRITTSITVNIVLLMFTGGEHRPRCPCKDCPVSHGPHGRVSARHLRCQAGLHSSRSPFPRIS